MLYDEWGGCLVDQDGRADASPLRASHGDAFIPEGVALPKLNSSGEILNVLLPKMVLLSEKNLGGSWE